MSPISRGSFVSFVDFLKRVADFFIASEDILIVYFFSKISEIICSL